MRTTKYVAPREPVTIYNGKKTSYVLDTKYVAGSILTFIYNVKKWTGSVLSVWL